MTDLNALFGNNVNVSEAAVRAISQATTPVELGKALTDHLAKATGVNWLVVEDFKARASIIGRFMDLGADSPIEFLAGRFFKDAAMSSQDEIAGGYTQADFQQTIAESFEQLGCDKDSIKVATLLGTIQNVPALLVRIETDKTPVFSFGLAVSQTSNSEVAEEENSFEDHVKEVMPDSGDRSRNEPVYLTSARMSRQIVDGKPFDGNTLTIIKKVAVANGWAEVQMHGQQLLFIANV